MWCIVRLLNPSVVHSLLMCAGEQCRLYGEHSGGEWVRLGEELCHQHSGHLHPHHLSPAPAFQVSGAEVLGCAWGRGGKYDWSLGRRSISVRSLKVMKFKRQSLSVCRGEYRALEQSYKIAILNFVGPCRNFLNQIFRPVLNTYFIAMWHFTYLQNKRHSQITDYIHTLCSTAYSLGSLPPLLHSPSPYTLINSFTILLE